ncbi:class IV lanthionine synthetase LanL [Kitasatospora sp. NPDC127059]|uniref:class IV lanthionine synthetase LanL n=1 Tax=unclassified Kitasatospora TaxID=2633591 RepID=UPI0036592847
MTGSIAGRRGWSDDTWSYLTDPRMPAVEHGWKLHVSARPRELDTVLALALPVLARYVCHAKWALGPQVLRELNSGVRSAGSVGKAITVYPAPGTAVALAEELVTVLRGQQGPQVVSDRRVAPDAPVYYRYGPFTGDYRTGRAGRLESVMVGPDGRLFDGLAAATYRCPPWAEDPFEHRAARVPSPAGHALGGRYRVTGGIARKPQGNVYRAVDLRTGLPVVIKQARAFVAEDETGADARDRLRHERAVLAALDGLPGVPRALDTFRHRSDEYLVMTSCGDRDLRRDVQEHGPYRPDRLAALATRLLRLLDGIHRRGVVVRDLKPDNIALDAEGRCRLVDFGISALDGAGPDGSTPGYSDPVRRPVGEPAEPVDDYHALGATLGFAATGLDPVIVDGDPAVNRHRTLAGLDRALSGPEHRQLLSLIAELTSPDPAERAVGAERLRTGRPAAGPRRTAPPRTAPRRTTPRRIDDGLLAEIIEHTTAYCVTEAQRIADPVLAARAAVPTPVDVYGGSAGLGLELLHHLHRPGVPAAVDALARWTAGQSRRLSPGFYSGRTGVELFLTAAGTGPGPGPGDGDGDGLPSRGPDGGPAEADLIEGVAGIGVGRLLLARLDPARLGVGGRERHLAVAAECARVLASGGARLSPAGPATPGRAALAEGLAHGEAGVTYFLLEYASSSGDPAALRRAERACARLAAVTPELLARATAPGATRRYGSWCRGLAGVGSVLVRAADRLGEPGYLALARRTARTCAALAPRMPLVTQCCGLAGVGELLVDVAAACGTYGSGCGSASEPDSSGGSEEFWAAARTVAAIILSRSGGTPSHPVFPDTGLARPSATWAGGSAGVLGFLRRLHERGGPRLGLIG